MIETHMCLNSQVLDVLKNQKIETKKQLVSLLVSCCHKNTAVSLTCGI